jgi:hypothetical protein
LPDWLAAGNPPPVEPAELWPDDVLTDEEWERGWFDRQVLQGAKQPWERSITPRCFGGALEDPEIQLLRRYFGDDITIRENDQ